MRQWRIKRRSFWWWFWWPKEDLESPIVVTAHAHPLPVQVCHHALQKKVTILKMRICISAAPRKSQKIKAKLICTRRKHNWSRVQWGYFIVLTLTGIITGGNFFVKVKAWQFHKSNVSVSKLHTFHIWMLLQSYKLSVHLIYFWNPAQAYYVLLCMSITSKENLVSVTFL